MGTKCCSRCNQIKEFDKFIKKRNICKKCSNEWAKKARDERYEQSLIKNSEKICKVCNKSKLISELIKNRYLCKECNNEKYRDKYKNDEEYRLKICLKDKNKNKNVKNEAQKRRYHNNPNYRFIRVQRSRISIALKNKDKNSIEYLGCSSEQYFNWLQYNLNNSFTIDNYGKEWHIDHVIPISNFNIMDEKEQSIAFNWRNTMPLSVKNNLQKGVKISALQIEQHYETLKKYHLENNLDLPQEFINLFAKHLDDGDPLKLSLPLTDGNV